MSEKKDPPHTNRGVTKSLPAVLAKAEAVDWVTATTDKDNVALDWYDVFLAHSSYREGWGNRWYTGVKSEGLRWGFSDRQGYVFVATGKVANKVWYKIVPASKNVSRLDLAVDVELTASVEDLAVRCYEKVKDRTDRQYTLVTNNRLGKTLYIGSRQSDQFGRLYDKGVETGELKAGVWWRYEVELKSVRSKLMARELLDRHINSSEEQAKGISSYVHNWFIERGVFAIYNPETINDMVISIGKKATSIDRKVEWLRTQVSPTLERLTKMGHRERALRALGIMPERTRVE